MAVALVSSKILNRIGLRIQFVTVLTPSPFTMPHAIGSVLAHRFFHSSAPLGNAVFQPTLPHVSTQRASYLVAILSIIVHVLMLVNHEFMQNVDLGASVGVAYLCK